MSKLVIDGINFNNQVIDGQGQVLTGDDCLLVKSIQNKNGSWLVPENIIIKNFKVNGSIRLIGLGINGEAELVRKSSYNKNHTKHAQQVAPKNITFDGITIQANKRIPFYVAPGCTYITLQNCLLTGWSEATAIYLCCESGYNKIINNTIRTKTKREIIAVDGSAYNTIENNILEHFKYGGIYLYRNSGEGGTVRHQPPKHNKIIKNTFKTSRSIWMFLRQIIYPAIWVGSRSYFIQYFIKFRNDDKGYSFGSSKTNSDKASKNIIKNNKPKGIRIRIWET